MTIETLLDNGLWIEAEYEFGSPGNAFEPEFPAYMVIKNAERDGDYVSLSNKEEANVKIQLWEIVEEKVRISNEENFE